MVLKQVNKIRPITAAPCLLLQSRNLATISSNRDAIDVLGPLITIKEDRGTRKSLSDREKSHHQRNTPSLKFSYP